MGITKNHIHTEDRIALARLFKALAHPARIAIVENLLIHDDLNCNALRSFIQLAQSTISRHIKELHEAGILGVRAVDNNAFYEVGKTALTNISDYVNDIILKIDTLKRDRSCLYSKPMQEIVFRNFMNTKNST